LESTVSENKNRKKTCCLYLADLEAAIRTGLGGLAMPVIKTREDQLKDVL
jgi:hypothetical protein